MKLFKILPLVLALGLTACSKPESTEQTAAPIAQPVVQGQQLRFPQGHPQLALLTVSAAKADVPTWVEFPARMVWDEDHTQRIYPAFAGRITRIHTDVGQNVQAGSVLAQLASPDFGMAQADNAKAQSDLHLAEKTLQRQKELLEAGIIARKDFDQAEADFQRAKAESQRASTRTALYGGSGNVSSNAVDQQLALRSTIAGLVVERNLNPGQEIRPEQSGVGVPPLFVVTDPRTMWVQVDAREAELGVLQPNAPFELVVTALPRETFQGKVIAVSDFIDPATRTIKIRGSVNNAKRLLKAEMLATVRAQRPAGTGVLVPASAITLNGTQHRVYLQTQAGVFEPRDVKIGYQGSHEVVVEQGLKVGDQVVSANVLLLSRAFKIATEAAAVDTKK